MDIVEKLRWQWLKPKNKPPELDEAADEIERLRTALNVAMTTLEQIATTPRNKGARRNAYATREFMRTQLKTPNA
jgi:hypothetical protein